MHNKKGFTLVELMVVIAIIAILAVGSITGYSAYIKKARDNTRVTELKAAENAITSYVIDQASSPNASPTSASTASTDVDEVLKAINGKMPSEPQSGVTSYYYNDCVGSENDHFIIAAIMESTSVGAAATDRFSGSTQILEVGNVDPSQCDTDSSTAGIQAAAAITLTNGRPPATLTGGWTLIQDV